METEARTLSANIDAKGTMAVVLLFEANAGDRGFLSADLKQLLTYAALNHASDPARPITQLGLF
jgi:hypothetical protein